MKNIHSFLSNIDALEIKFTPQEINILILALKEKTTFEIACKLNIVPSIVEEHRKKIYQKINLVLSPD